MRILLPRVSHHLIEGPAAEGEGAAILTDMSKIMHYFNSSAIYAASYDATSQNLTIWFTSSGQAYDYPGVPLHIWNGLLAASSTGTYFNMYIRDQYAA